MNVEQRRKPVDSVVALLADVDGTLLNDDKVLTEKSIEAVKRLRLRGGHFCITSGRPPHGLRNLVQPLELTVAMAAFNGALLVRPDLSVIDQKRLAPDLVQRVLETVRTHGLDTWIFTATEWYVEDPGREHVEREARNNGIRPVVVQGFDGLFDRTLKIVGVSDDFEAVARAEDAVRAEFAHQISAARSQPYYLDVTHPDAHKGTVVERFADYLRVPTSRIATIGDQSNDVLMFERSGLSIAMGNASPEVQERADFVTTSDADEGFANAVERFVLSRISAANTVPSRPR